MDSTQIVRGPTLRQAALITVAGYLLGTGVPFASFSVLPKIFVATNAAQTSQNILANQSLFVAAIFAMLLNFIGMLWRRGASTFSFGRSMRPYPC